MSTKNLRQQLEEAQKAISLLHDELTEMNSGMTALDLELEKRIDERTSELRASEEQYRRLFEAARDGILILDAETGMVVDVNPFLVDMLGFSREQFIGKRIWELGFFKDIALNKLNFTELQQKEYIRYEGLPLETALGKLINVEFVSHIYQVNHNKVAQCNIRDITERMRAEEELKKHREHLEELVKERTSQFEASNKELDTFAYSVSHDLRTPLRAIDGFSRILLEDFTEKLDDEGKRVLNVIRSSTVRMGQLIDDILSFSRLGRIEMSSSEIDMERLARSVVDELKPTMNDRNVELIIDTLPPSQGDKAMIRVVMVNLINNAIKFTRPRTAANIEIGGRSENSENIYFVRDNGVGFDMNYQNKLFGVFQRLHSQDEFEGTGIGLSLVKQVITRHGGRVWAEGKVDEGTVIHFTLPKKKEQDNEHR